MNLKEAGQYRTEVNTVKGLDGLRVYAIAMILACHVGALADIAGGIGNKIFFSMSGFLAYYSILRCTGFRGALTFYLKRFVRIVPVFWVVVLIVWRMFPGIFNVHDFSSPHSLLLNLFFIKNYGHFWFLQHLVLMYLLVPLFFFLHKGIVSLLLRAAVPELGARLGSALLFLVLAVLEKKYLTADVLSLSGEGSHRQFQVWMFLFGFAAAICGDALVKSGFREKHRGAVQIGRAVTTVVVPVLFVLLTVSVLPPVHHSGKLLFLSGEYLRTILACVIYLLFLLTEDSLIARFLSCGIMVRLAQLSFGIYLWHFFFLSYFRTESGLHNFVFNYFISLCLALFTYLAVERPVNRLFKGRH